MDKLPEEIKEQIYRYHHQILYYKVMYQLKTYRINRFLLYP